MKTKKENLEISSKKKKKNICIGKKKKDTKTRRKNKIYSTESLQEALEALREGQSYRKVAEQFSIPIATLFKNHKQLQKKNKPGPPTVLSDQKEKDIEDWIIYRSKTGIPVTKNELLDSVQTYLIDIKRENPFIDNRPGRHWFESFKKRHPNIVKRTAQNIELNRIVYEDDLKKWFKDIEDYLTENNLLGIDASRIFNCDETSVQLCPKPSQVLAERGSKSVYQVNDGSDKENLSVLFTYNAEGTRAPPLILFNYKVALPKSIQLSLPSGWGAGLVDNGFMTGAAFYEYVANIFYPWLVSTDITFPVILFCDGHTSHITVPLVKFCREKKIEIIILLPHSSHLTQPLDVAFFKPFKDHWRKVVPRWKIEYQRKSLKKEDFAKVLWYALNTYQGEKNAIVNGFRASGLYPFDANIIDYSVLDKKKKSKSSTDNVTCTLPHETHGEMNCSTSSCSNELELIEKRLSIELLQQFKAAEVEGSWTGDVTKQGLFEFWLEVKKSGNF